MPALTREATSKTVQTSSYNLHYHEAGSGYPVIMTHGGGPGASGWGSNRWVFDAFAAKHRTILIDLPGFGGSQPIAPMEPRDLMNAKAIVELMDALDIPKAHLVGGPMGASIIRFAVEYGDRLNKLVMANPAGGGVSIFKPQPSEGGKAERAFYLNPTRETARWFLELYVCDRALVTDEVIDDRYQDIVGHPQHIENFMKGATNTGARLNNPVALLDQVKAKTLLVWGRDDRSVPLDHALLFLWKLPDAQLHVFGECGHWPQYEKADEFSNLVLKFLA
jgi:2,6-dioxo-6-phenylhexa-3-enoate hydrolase